MAVQIEMARPADLAGDYLRGVETGAQIKEARQRLDVQQQETQARLQQAAAQQQQQHAVEQQRIAVTQAYHQQEAELKKRQLDEAAAMNAQKTAAAARAFQAKQDLQKAMDDIDSDAALSPEQKDAKKTTAIMRMGFMTGAPGSEISEMIKASRPPKAEVPATVTDKGDYLQIKQPNGTVTIHPKPNSGKEPTIKVKVSDSPGGILNVPASHARATIAGLPQDMADDPVNKAAISLAPAGPYDRTPKTSPSTAKSDTPVTKLDTPADVAAAYKAGKLTRAQAAKMLKDDFGIKE